MNASTVQAKVHELSLKRLDELNLPPGTNREKKLADLERQLKEVVLGVADGLVAKVSHSDPFHANLINSELQAFE